MPDSLLDNELIHKYFGCNEVSCPSGHPLGWQECVALRILTAMQEPIKKGDLVLCFPDIGSETKEPTAWHCDYEKFHPHLMRLPSRFQPKKECESVYWNCTECSYRAYAPYNQIEIVIEAHRKNDHQPPPQRSDRSEASPAKPEECPDEANLSHDRFHVGECCKPSPSASEDAVEKKISILAEEFRCYAQMREQPGWFRAELRELVQLVVEREKRNR